MTTTLPKVDPTGPITDVEQLKAHLYDAAKLELSTVPLYLYAAYSIKTQSYSQWDPGMSAFRTIRSVVIEEMLHLSLARNVLVAIGGGDAIRFYDRDFIPAYPEAMLHRTPDLPLHLERCTPELMREVFMPLELPAETDAPPQPDRYNTIGQFYAAIVDGLERLSGPELWRDPHVDLQYTSNYWNQDGGGYPVAVSDLPSSLDAIKTIVEQGEGVAPGDEEVPLSPTKPLPGADEYSHYAKFKRIANGVDKIGEVWPLPTDPRASDFPEPAARLAELFNACYCFVLCMLDELYRLPSEKAKPGERSKRYGLERSFIAAMGGLLYPIADLLVRQAGPASGEHAAPTFEFYEFREDSKRAQLAGMCDALLGAYPSLGGDNGVRQLIEYLPEV